MLTVSHAVLVGLLVSWSALAGGQEHKAEEEPEVKWARRIVDDYWRAILLYEDGNAAGLLSPEYSRALSMNPQNISPDWVLRRQLGLGYGDLAAYKLTSHVLAPDRSEVIFRGRVMNKGAAIPFTMRVAKEPHGKWCIRLFSVHILETHSLYWCIFGPTIRAMLGA